MNTSNCRSAASSRPESRLMARKDSRVPQCRDCTVDLSSFLILPPVASPDTASLENSRTGRERIRASTRCEEGQLERQAVARVSKPGIAIYLPLDQTPTLGSAHHDSCLEQRIEPQNLKTQRGSRGPAKFNSISRHLKLSISYAADLQPSIGSA